MDKKKVIEFYNAYASQQVETGINERIHEMLRRLKSNGLHSGSSILELGCGIGTLTYLLAKNVSGQKIESVDISEESVKIAKQKLGSKGIRFIAADVVEYNPVLKQPDFITLFDVIEHIPMDRHKALFSNLEKICGSNTKILINIPHPDAIQFDIDHNPAVLQVIDQPLPLNFIVENIVHNGLELVSFENHSIWAKNDYQFFVIRKKRAYQEIKLSSERSFIEKAVNKIKRVYRNTFYKY